MSSQRENRNRPEGGSIYRERVHRHSHLFSSALFFPFQYSTSWETTAHDIYTGTLEEFLLQVEEKSIDYIYLRTEPN